jgi:hypothetical protein
VTELAAVLTATARFLKSYDEFCYKSELFILCLVYLIKNMFVYSVYLDLGFIKSSLECWSVLCPSAPIFGKLGLKLWNELQFNYDLEQNAF